MADLGGFWTFVQPDVLDNERAIKAGYARGSGQAAAHGTYKKKQLYWIRPVKNDFQIFNDEGEGALFSFQSEGDLKKDGITPADFRANSMPEVWKSVPGQLEFPEVPAGDEYAPNGYKSSFPAKLRLGQGEVGHWPPPNALDGGAGPQYIFYAVREDAFYWLPGKPSASVEGLKFTRTKKAIPGDPVNGDLNFVKFASIFNLQQGTHIPQLVYPFFGFNVLSEGFGSKTAGLYSGVIFPGTGADNKQTNPGQDIRNSLLFEFPRADSYGYVQATQLSGFPNVPLGISARTAVVSYEREHTEVISSTYDTARSWAVTAGFSAGIEKMLSLSASGSYKDQVQLQEKHEDRYTISRSVAPSAVIWTDFMAMTLHRRFVAAVFERLEQLGTPNGPAWGNFLNDFGTHYLHSITVGNVRYARTRCTLEAEAKARSQGLTIKGAASVTFEGITAGAEASYGEKWSKKLGLEHSVTDVECNSVGTAAEPMGIFYDLRPISELFCPAFFEYDPVTSNKHSPRIWRELRSSLEHYLASKGLNQPLEHSPDDDFTPRLVKFSLITVQTNVDDRYGTNKLAMVLNGNITLSNPDRKPVPDQYLIPPSPSPGQAPQPLDKSVVRVFQNEHMDGRGGDFWAYDNPACLIMTKGNRAARVLVSYAVNVMNPDKLSESWTGFFAHPEIVEDMTEPKKQPPIVQNEVNPPSVSIYYKWNLLFQFHEQQW